MEICRFTLPQSGQILTINIEGTSLRFQEMEKLRKQVLEICPNLNIVNNGNCLSIKTKRNEITLTYHSEDQKIYTHNFNVKSTELTQHQTLEEGLNHINEYLKTEQ